MKLHIMGNQGSAYKGGITTWGCIWEQGSCSSHSHFRLNDANGLEVPVQSRITAFWPNGSVKWTSHTADSRLLSEEIEVIALKSSDAAESYSGIVVERDGNTLLICAGRLSLVINESQTDRLFERVSWDNGISLINGRTCLQTEERHKEDNRHIKQIIDYSPVVTKISVEEQGNLQCIMRYEGHFVNHEDREIIPYIIRMKIGFDMEELSFQYTFIYDGDEHRDYLKGIGLHCDMPLKGPLYNRHVKFMSDDKICHESPAHLISWKPRVPVEIYEKQMSGAPVILEGSDKELVDGILPHMPHWSEYDMCQDYSDHFVLRKKQEGEDLCSLEVLHGHISRGGASMGSENGSLMIAMRDFREKYPSGYTIKGLDKDKAEIFIWLWSPSAEAMDFRHYASRGYNSVCYEGYDYFGATPYGIANTSEFSLRFSDKIIPSDSEIISFSQRVDSPVLYVSDPEYYHRCKAFGYWSLPRRENETEEWIEQQMDTILNFYDKEVEQRGWYGMFNYGDFMHTYDRTRHQWRYDMGGYAWDNTELVPTLWLWYSFLRSGSPKAFKLAEKLTRHTSEVDVYHKGQYKGMGSRHNVRHWGCPCKESRIAMAGHHRVYYYLTGDRRLEDLFEELKDSEEAYLNRDPLGDFYEKDKMVYPSHARSGPDWSSLCSNWMTQWERYNDVSYRDKILQGVNDIKLAPLKLISGPDFEFNPKDARLRYIGETPGGTHLQICMGAPQIWMELSDLLDDPQWNKMMADYGRFYFLDPKDQMKESDGLVEERLFSLPMMATAMGAYGAWFLKDDDTAERTWRHLLQGLISESNRDGFSKQNVKNSSGKIILEEIPWISTNFVAQWCLNMIVALEFIRPQLPETLDDVVTLIGSDKPQGFRKA